MIHTLALLLCAAVPQTPAEPSSWFRVPAPVTPALRSVLEAQFDVLHSSHGAEALDVVVLPDELDRFLAIAPRAVLTARGRPFAEIHAERRAAGPEAPDAGYYTVAEIEQAIDDQVAAHPTRALKVDLSALPGGAQTHEGRSIYALKVSDNVATDEDEPAMLIIAQHHARELNSPHMVIGAMQRVLAGYATDPALQAVVDGYELYFVPMVNPDGVDYVWTTDNFWRKNRRQTDADSFGVDLNRNYPTLWNRCGGSTNPDSNIYVGPAAASEPETATMRNLAALIRPEVYIDFHSSGQEVLFTYPPCANTTTTIDDWIEARADDLRAPMTYDKRAPSASGEAPEDHWNRNGTLSFLIEIGTSFQPDFATTAAEEVRVWPGVEHVLKNWRPAVRGHVRSIFRRQPIEATITFTPDPFLEGERALSRARDGRYGLWLPNGTWQVTWSAPGFQPETRSITVTQQDQPQDVEIRMVPDWQPAVLTKSGTSRIGTTDTLTYTSPGDANQTYWVALSGGTAPGIALGDRTLPLNGDGLMILSLTSGLVSNNFGTLDGSGAAVAQFPIPNIPAIAGITIYAGGITFELGYPSAVKKWSAAVPIQLAQ